MEKHEINALKAEIGRLRDEIDRLETKAERLEQELWKEQQERVKLLSAYADAGPGIYWFMSGCNTNNFDPVENLRHREELEEFLKMKSA